MCQWGFMGYIAVSKETQQVTLQPISLTYNTIYPTLKGHHSLSIPISMQSPYQGISSLAGATGLQVNRHRREPWLSVRAELGLPSVGIGCHPSAISFEN